VIELGSGGGQGLNLLVDVSEKIVGYDINKINIDISKKIYCNDVQVTFAHNDIEKEEFGTNNIQTIIIFETLYYIENIKELMQKLYRALKSNGKIIICTANKNLHSFNPSSYSTKYLNAKELYSLGKEHSFEVEIFSSFPDNKQNIWHKVINKIKRFAIKFYLIPKTMKAKKILKDIFSGSMVLMPEKYELDTEEYSAPLKVDPQIKDIYSTAIFAVFTK